MRYEELYKMTDERLLNKTKNYLEQLRGNIVNEDKTKEEILELLNKTIFYIDFHLNVNKSDLNNLDEIGQELKGIWDKHQI